MKRIRHLRKIATDYNKQDAKKISANYHRGILKKSVKQPE
jgi:hypothetical protein